MESNINNNTNNTFNLDDELRKFALNDYVKKTSRVQYLQKTEVNDKDYEYNDMLLTNAYNDDPIADTYEKSRYNELRTKYIEINSKARNTYTDSINSKRGREAPSLFSTGSDPVTDYDFYVYQSHCTVAESEININAFNNKIDIRLWFYIGNDIYSETSCSILLRLGEYSISALQTELQNAFDNQINNVFTVTLEEDIFDPSNIKFQLSVQLGYKFTAIFPYYYDNNNDNSNSNSNKRKNNRPLYKSPSHYRIYLNTLYRNVKTIRLISSHFINTCTIINKTNNIIKYSINIIDQQNTSDSIEIPVGNYIPSALASLITDSINFEVFGRHQIPNYLSWEINNDRLKFYTSSKEKEKEEGEGESEGFSLLFSGNLWEMLGFPSKSTEGYVNNFSGSFDIDLRKAEYLWLDINGFNTIFDTLSDRYYFNKVVFTQNRDKQDESVNGSDLLFYPVCTIIDINYNLSYIDVKLFDEYGLPYETTKDHWFTLEIVYPEDRLIGTNIQTSRDDYKQPIAPSIF